MDIPHVMHCSRTPNFVRNKIGQTCCPDKKLSSVTTSQTAFVSTTHQSTERMSLTKLLTLSPRETLVGRTCMSNFVADKIQMWTVSDAFLWLDHESGMDYHTSYDSATHFRVSSLTWRHTTSAITWTISTSLPSRTSDCVFNDEACAR